MRDNNCDNKCDNNMYTYSIFILLNIKSNQIPFNICGSRSGCIFNYSEMCIISKQNVFFKNSSRKKYKTLIQNKNSRYCINEKISVREYLKFFMNIKKLFANIKNVLFINKMLKKLTNIAWLVKSYLFLVFYVCK